MAGHTNIRQSQREWWILWTFCQSIISSLLHVSEEDKGLLFPGVSHMAEGMPGSFTWTSLFSSGSCDHELASSGFNQPFLSPCWMFLCSWNIFPTAKCVPLALPFQPAAEGLQEKKSGFIKVAVWINKALSTLWVAFLAALAANLFYFSCREVHLNLSQL